MPESDSSEPQFTDVEALPRDPIVSAHGSPVSGRLVLLVVVLLIIILAVALAYAVSQGIFVHPEKSY